MALAVRNFQALNQTFKHAPKETRLALRREYRTIAQPVQRMAESLAATRISHLAAGSPWARFRLGITQKLVYLAPRQNGVRGKGRRRRSKFGGLLMSKAMEPALHLNEERVVRDFEELFDRLTRDWNRGP
jgi:hypothetical protein